MTYPRTPRADRLARLYETRDRVEAEITRLEDAERQDDDYTATDYTAERNTRARQQLLARAETAEFRARLEAYGAAS